VIHADDIHLAPQPYSKCRPEIFDLIFIQTFHGKVKI
jgi:hypothetical protein